MKFTPDNLLQIYLDGSFTEEAQAEFDRLVRKDPLFAERVAQAVAQRLGPVRDSTVDSIASRLDGKIGNLWEAHKPSPLLRALRLGGKAALCLLAAGGLYFGFEHGMIRLPHTSGAQGPAALAPASITLNANQATSTGREEPAGTSQKTENTKSVRVQKSAPGQTLTGSPQNSAVPVGKAQGGPALELGESVQNQSPLPAASNPSVGSKNLEALNPSGSGVENQGQGSTQEGNSLRVSIVTPKTQAATVTVFDVNGLLVRHLFQGTLPSGEHSVDWDGKDEMGNAVLPGDYTVILDLGGKKMSGVLKVLPGN